VGILYCNHETEADAYGSDPVPCPFCGFGGSNEASPGESEPNAFEDSTDALRNALFDQPSSEGSDDTIGPYW